MGGDPTRTETSSVVYGNGDLEPAPPTRSAWATAHDLQTEIDCGIGGEFTPVAEEIEKRMKIGAVPVRRIGERTWTEWDFFGSLVRLGLPAPGWPS